MLSNDAVLAEEWRAELARLDPPIRLRLPGDDRQGDVVAALVDGPVDGRLADWRDIRLVIGLNAGVEDLLGDPTLPSIPLLRMVCPETVALMKEYVCHYVIRARGRFEGLEAAQRAGRWEAGPGFPPPAAFRVAVMGLGELGLRSGLLRIWLEPDSQNRPWHSVLPGAEGAGEHAGNHRRPHLHVATDTSYPRADLRRSPCETPSKRQFHQCRARGVRRGSRPSRGARSRPPQSCHARRF
jgi:hypothetical protein